MHWTKVPNSYQLSYWYSARSLKKRCERSTYSTCGWQWRVLEREMLTTNDLNETIVWDRFHSNGLVYLDDGSLLTLLLGRRMFPKGKTETFNRVFSSELCSVGKGMQVYHGKQFTPCQGTPSSTHVLLGWSKGKSLARVNGSSQEEIFPFLEIFFVK